MEKIHDKLNWFFDLEEDDKLEGKDILWIVGGAILITVLIFGGMSLL